MERLTKIISGYAHGAEGVSADNLTGCYCRGCFEATACIEKLSEYEDLEEKGRCLKPECIPGDYVWEINPERNMISEYEVTGIRYGINKTFHYMWALRKGIYGDLDGFWDKNIGETVFLTPEKAQQALSQALTLKKKEKEKKNE